MTMISTNEAPLARALTSDRRGRAAIPAGKRMLDIAVSALMLLILSPLMLVTALAVKLTSPGPVFFVQTRVGLNGQTFGMIKFRSMYRDAEARRAALLAQSDRGGVCFKQKNDPRVTSVGRIIRRYSIDELPQLINVLKGDMSLVGPRPALPSEVAAYPAHALGRLAALPGITGVWQVSGRADVSFDQMVEMDIAYARSVSLRRDLAVLLLTIPAVLSGRGAY
ncbi:sugar transferase [Roseicyclus persicicus]|uniref:Sugar transferase n=1 Tax=Roseicyclus persicicus TaxID=2650661 RepID=A0A7X6JWD1_9RHOB|nr:sugar transferase [Roseibacterium persicicum]